MSTITIGSTDYRIYGTLALAQEYNAVSVLPGSTAWATGDDDYQGKYLVNAARLLDRLDYKASAGTFELRDAIQAFRDASYELALMLIADPGLWTAATSGKNIKRVSVDGGPSVSFFNPTLGITGMFDKNIMDLIGDYLAGAGEGGISGSYSSGTDGTHTSIDDGVSQPLTPYGLREGLP